MPQRGVANARHITARHATSRSHGAQHIELAPQFDCDVGCCNCVNPARSQDIDEHHDSFRDLAIQLSNNYSLFPQRAMYDTRLNFECADVCLAAEELRARYAAALEILRGFDTVQEWHNRRASECQLARNSSAARQTSAHSKLSRVSYIA